MKEDMTMETAPLILLVDDTPFRLSSGSKSETPTGSSRSRLRQRNPKPERLIP